MKCPACGASDLVSETREMDANGVKVTVTADFCPTCGEGVLDQENGDRYGAALRQGKETAGKQ